MTHEPRFLAGLDLGKLQDHSALAIVERRQYQTGFDHVYWVPLIEWDLRIRRLVRFPLHTSYRDLMTLVEKELHHPELGITTPLIVDATGPGEVFLDFLRGSAIPLVPVNITSGGNVTQSHGRWNVPKSELVNALAILIEQEKLGVVRELPLANALYEELTHFDARIQPSGHTRFGALDAGGYDDLALAVALACWYARKLWPPEPKPRPSGQILCV